MDQDRPRGSIVPFMVSSRARDHLITPARRLSS